MTSCSSTPSYRDNAPLCTVRSFRMRQTRAGACTFTFWASCLHHPQGSWGVSAQLWTAVLGSASLFWQACSVPLKAPIVLSGFDKSVQRGQTTTHTHTERQGGWATSWAPALHAPLTSSKSSETCLKSSVCTSASSACFLFVCVCALRACNYVFAVTRYPLYAKGNSSMSITPHIQISDIGSTPAGDRQRQRQ